MEIYYKDRDTEKNALNKAIQGCKEQIKIAPQAAKGLLNKYPNQLLPSHTGYHQLRIIYKK